MAKFIYPTSSLDRLSTYTNLLGEFWPDIYGGSDLVLDYLRGSPTTENQNFNDLVEAQDTLGRRTIPIFHVDKWFKLALDVTDRVAGATGSEVVFPLDNKVDDAPVITDLILEPTAVFNRSIDFRIDTTLNKIHFRRDPFLDTRLIQDPTGKLTLWMLRASIDRDYLLNHFGSVIDVTAAPTQNYKNLFNAILDAHSGASSYDSIARVIAAITDIPNVRNEVETVTDIFSDAKNLVIATNLEIYKFKLGATSVVAVDDVVNRNDQLIDAVVIFEPNKGQTPAFLSDITLGPGFLLNNLTGPLTFSNSVEVLTVIPGVSSFTKLTWPLTGAGGDITAFFDDLHARGVAAGATLANFFDIRPQPQSTQPLAGSLPTTINPAEFIFENVLRNNGFIVDLDTAFFGPDAFGTAFLFLLREVIPPHSTAIVLT